MPRPWVPNPSCPRGTFLWPASPFRGVDILNAFKKCAEKINCQWDKLTPICTDGAPAMTRCNVGFCAKLEQFAGRTLLKYPSIIYQESFCWKSLQMKNVMSMVVKCVNDTSCSFEKKIISTIAELRKYTVRETSTLYRSELAFAGESTSPIARRQGPPV